MAEGVDDNISNVNNMYQFLSGYIPQMISNTLAASPLVLDLNGDGVSTISILDNTAKFDLTDRTGIAHGWISPQDGFLALDKNKNGVIDSYSELFGSEDRDGFTILAEHDANNDSVIDASDEIYDALLIWKDGNSDGISQATELYSLHDLGIASINLNAGIQAVSDQFNDVPLISSYTLSDGSTREIADVYFRLVTEEAKQVVDISASDSLVVVGSLGDDTLAGNERDQVFFGGVGADTFVFSNASGHDTIADFDVLEDIIEIHSEHSASIASIFAGSSQNGDDTVLNIDSNTSITLWNVDLNTLTSDNLRVLPA